MVNNIVKIISGFLFFTLLSFSVFPAGWHPASQITPGQFSDGNFSFNGSVGIGTTNPTNAKLEILSTTSRGIWANSTFGDGVAGISNATNKSAIYGLASNGAYSGYFEDGNFIVMNGNVGIGTSSPIYTLHINSSLEPRIKLEDSGTFQAHIGLSGGNDGIINGSVRGDLVLAANLGRSILFGEFSDGSGNNTNVIIDAYGNVGIGTSTPSAKLDIKDNSNNGIIFRNNVNMKWFMYIENGSGISTSKFFINDNDKNQGVYLSHDTTAWVANSDRRLKENISLISNALNRISVMRGVTYNFIGNSNTEIGVIAQEVKQEFPEIVDFSGEYLGVQYSKIAPILINAIKELKLEKDLEIQEQQKQIENQQKQIEELKEIICLDHPKAEICIKD